VLLSLGSWHWIFLAGLPLSVLSLSAAWALAEGDVQEGIIDVTGLLLLSAAAALIFVAFKWLITEPLLSLLLLSAGAFSGALLVRRGLNQERPLMPLDLLANRFFRRSVAASICCFIAQSAGLVMLPFHLEGLLGRDLLRAGLVLASWPIAVAAASAAANRLTRVENSSFQCVAGAALLSAGLVISAVLPSGSGAWLLAGGAAICGAGFGLFQLANNRNLFLTANSGRSAAAGGMQGTARLAGQTAGTLLASLVFHSVHLPAGAARIGFLIAAGFAVVAAFASWRGRLHNSAGASSATPFKPI
jgi:DHA2 family multidrug resistance protein-like MFS transporter